MTGSNRTRRSGWLALLGAAAALLAAGCGAAQDDGGPSPGARDAARPPVASPGPESVAAGTARLYPADERKTAPRITGELLDGGRFDLAALRGQVVVLNVWASWCAPCRREAHELEQTHQATKGLGVAFVGIDIRDDRETAKQFQKEFGVTYPSVYDQEARLPLAFRDVPPNSIPTTIVVDRRGRVAAVFRKALLRVELEPAIRRIAAEAP